MLVACAPEVPRIAAHDFFRRKINGAIHRLENVGSDLRKIGCCFSCRFRFIDRLVLFAAGECEQRARSDVGSESIETEKVPPRCQQ